MSHLVLAHCCVSLNILWSTTALPSNILAVGVETLRLLWSYSEREGQIRKITLPLEPPLIFDTPSKVTEAVRKYISSYPTKDHIIATTASWLISNEEAFVQHSNN